MREQLAKQKNLATAYAQEEANKKWAEYVESCRRIESRIEMYEIYLNSAQVMYEMYADLYNKYECEMQFLLWCKEKAEKLFNTKYESLLREGVWQDSKYLEDNSYYLDAEKVAVDSCGPKITYTISVTDLSMLDKYKFTDFKVGDTTYVEDYEFFGDDIEGTSKLYQEKTIVSMLTCNLDNPSKNSISLQNYSTKFDDLFSRVTASVQSLTFNENIYQRAARFTPSGQIDENTIQETLNNEDLVIVGNQDVQIDGNGILVTDLRIPSNKVKIVGSGVYLTGNGGVSWYGAFENGGINASLLTVGSINTGSITIANGNYSNFLWDSNGITAYAKVEKKPTQSVAYTDQYVVSGTKFVRFNQYGLFFIQDSTSLLDKSNNKVDIDTTLASWSPDQSADFLMNNADLAITYNGFSIRGAGKKVSFTSEDGILMTDSNGEVVVQLGFIQGLSGIDDFWGLRAKGAYIEGRLYSEEIFNRSISNQDSQGSTVSNSVIDINRCMLGNGELQIWRNIIKDDPDKEETVDVENHKITTFGSTLLKVKNTNASNNNEDGDDGDSESGESADVTIGDYDYFLGSSIHIEEKGRFWSLSTWDENTPNVYKTKFIYSVIAQEGKYEADTFYMYSNLKFKKGKGVIASVAQQSDERLKNTINNVDNRYMNFFDMLNPKTFKYNSESNETPLHIGLIAQEVQQARQEAGLSQYELGVVTPITEEKYSNINYIELLTLSIAKIKQLEERIKQLEK